MTELSRKSLFAAFTVAMLAAPAAFAQSTSTSAEPPTDATPATTANAGATTAADASADAGATAGAPGTVKKSWADIDGDKDGKLSKTEAAAVPALGQMFDTADADADGALTTDEYKAYLAKAQGQPETK